MSVGTLERWRWQKTGPAYTRIGGAVVYSLRNVRAWERRNTINTDCRAPRERALRDLFDNGDFTIDAKPPPQLIMLPIKTVAAMLGVGAVKVRRLVDQGKLDEVRLTRRRLITLASAEALARSLQREAKANARACAQGAADAAAVARHAARRESNERRSSDRPRGRTAKKFSGPSPGSAHRG